MIILRNRWNISSFYSWNLSRRFGSDWYQKWIDLTVLRMNNWGINTIGNWSDPNLGESHRKAYVATLEGWGIEEGKMGMPDVYDPGYTAMLIPQLHFNAALKKMILFFSDISLATNHPGREGSQIW